MALKNLVDHPVVGSIPDLEKASWAGRLNIRSAFIRVLVGLWKNASSLLGCISTNSVSNSESNSSETFMPSGLFFAAFVKIVPKLRMVTSLLDLFIVARFSARPSGAMMCALGYAAAHAERKR